VSDFDRALFGLACWVAFLCILPTVIAFFWHELTATDTK
jgi:hypothetical protein